jgi:histone acetyltransferase MYST1
VCQFCLDFYTRKIELEAHSEKCKDRAPPGDEIYRDETLSVFEFDAKK